MTPDVARGANPAARELLDLRMSDLHEKRLVDLERIEKRLALPRFEELHEPFELLALLFHEFARANAVTSSSFERALAKRPAELVLAPLRERALPLDAHRTPQRAT